MAGAVDTPVPYDIRAEEAVLGALLLDRDAIISVAPFLKTEDFYREAHGQIYQAILNLYARRQPADIILLRDELQRVDTLEDVGGEAYLMKMAASTPTAVHVEHYARIVERAAVLRRLISAGGQIAALGWSEAQDVNEVLSAAERLLLEVSTTRGGRGYTSIGDAVARYADQLDRLEANPTQGTGVPSGILDLDARTGGWQKSRLAIVAGRPGMGKTSLLGHMCKVAAMRSGRSVGFFSAEMSTDELLERWYADTARIDSMKLRTPHTLTDEEWGRIGEATSDLAALPIFIDDTPNININELRAKAFRMKAEHDIGLLAVDYIGLLQAPRKDQNRVLEIGEITRKLKMLARELEIPVIAAAQLNRMVEHRRDHIPVLSDLRDSGEIEQHADIVIFIHRPDAYEDTASPDNAGIMELHIAKHRAGPLGVVHVRFVSAFTQLQNIAGVGRDY